MFVITGRREDVLTAKREIQLAADHFSQIRARRGTVPSNPQLSSPQPISCQSPSKTTSPKPIINHNLSSVSSGHSSASISPANTTQPLTEALYSRSISMSPKAADLSLPTQKCQQLTFQQQPALLPGQVCKKVTVPYQVVGLVVGPKGTTIKRIQQNTNTYIVTPSRDSQPVFEIQGLPDNVEAAKLEIETYIQLRTNQGQSGQVSINPASSTSSSCSASSSFSGAYVEYDDLYSSSFDCVLSPEATGLFQSVDDFTSSIWSPSASALGGNIADDLLVNSLQQTLSNANRSASSSSSSSSSFCSNEATLGSLAAPSSNSFMFLNDCSPQMFNGLGYNFSQDAFSYSPVVDKNEMILNSIFQHEQLLQNLSLSNNASAEQFNLNEYNFYGYSNDYVDSQNF